AARQIAAAVRAVVEQAGRAAPPQVVVAGLAGARREQVQTRVRDLVVEQLGTETAVHITTDGAVALESAFAGQPGIVVCAGSGSIAYARDTEGGVWRAGGHGWRIGDEGSGYALARAALSAVGKALDGRGRDTTLAVRLSRAVGVESANDLVGWSLEASPSQVAALAHEVVNAAADNDDVAQALVGQAAHDLAKHVEALLPRLDQPDRIRVALAGGLLTEGSKVRDALIDVLAAAHPDLMICSEPVDPAVGALRLAARLP
ncbi:MAG: hypothetical protein OER90_19950, partial [Gemmatimonadota bacterium]|nr:hypothetical protein [Gemmatimonadota bacterium]